MSAFDSEYAIVALQLVVYLISFACLMWSVQNVFASYAVTMLLGLDIGPQHLHASISYRYSYGITCFFALQLIDRMLIKGWLARGILRASGVSLVAGLMLALRPALASYVVILLVAVPLLALVR